LRGLFVENDAGMRLDPLCCGTRGPPFAKTASWIESCIRSSRLLFGSPCPRHFDGPAAERSVDCCGAMGADERRQKWVITGYGDHVRGMPPHPSAVDHFLLRSEPTRCAISGPSI